MYCKAINQSILIDSETSKKIACTIVGFRLDYVNSIRLSLSIVFNEFKTPWLESLLAQVPTPPQL